MGTARSTSGGRYLVNGALAALPLLLTAQPALAYLGPGLGAGTVAIVLGFIASIFLALFAVFWYPIKRLIKGRKARKETAADREDTDGASGK